jgi:polyisoprenyl-teichoic acid--peptidoglycan teichoic acid transferase
MSDTTHGYGLKKAVFSFLTVLILFGALYSGYSFFATFRALIGYAEAPFVENVVSSRPAIVPGHSEPQILDDIVRRKERVNLLLLGIDQRQNDPGPYRTDTIILLSVDPATNSAAMLSIPRDLWVTIPGFGENRINTAHYLGDARDYPGGGVALSKRTVWYALGVPVHYYIRINFTGFEQMVDAIGGLTIDVPERIYDDKYPDENYGTMVIEIPAGIQVMDGKTALQYARSRHGRDDFDRMVRQQALLLAARDKALSLDIPITRIPKLLDLAGESIKTDLSLDEMMALADIAKRVRREDIRYGVIDSSMTTTVVRPSGAMVEVAHWDKVQALVNDLFPAPVPESAPSPSIARAQLISEAARIALENGTLDETLAQQTAEMLRDAYFNVVRYDNADRFDHAETIIIQYTNVPYTVDALAAELGTSPDNVRKEPPVEPDIDLLVILGRDIQRKKN